MGPQGRLINGRCQCMKSAYSSIPPNWIKLIESRASRSAGGYMPHKSLSAGSDSNTNSNQFHNRFYRRAKREITSRVRRDLRQSALGWNSPSSQHQYINNMKSNNLDPNAEHTATNKNRIYRDRRRNKFTSYSEFMRSNQ